MLEQVEPRARGQHRIEVILCDGSHRHLTPRVLDVMLDNNKILQFKRSDGWATVGIHPVRVKRQADFCPLYYGQERRLSSCADSLN